MVKITEEQYYEKIQYQYALYHVYEKDVVNVRTKETRRGIVTESEGYYTSLNAMLEKIARHTADDDILAGKITTIQEHIAAIERTYKLIFPKLMGENENEAEL